ncbi:DUF3160 domain-containing protein [Prosthecobacter dejongeii]|uniref:DUF3160 domain-containing protein n=1 Tax=Prosthecobacter dejongeii TaxID=48465 RepID=A0A7W7YHB0_9BACT|nr:DUF3160 domain-containing protein [Prosthecobacter dejongeii]MBB5035850.1 hypothetical protein [Prosthecobacter dejongeii]
MRLCILSLLVTLATSHAQFTDPGEKAKEALEKSWQAAARQAGLGVQAVRHLEAEKVLMTDDEMLQSFQAYLASYRRDGTADSSDLPYFITTDALFQAYAWCLQKTVAAVERSQAEGIRDMMETLMIALEKADTLMQGDRALIQAAQQRAQFVVGVAAVLLDLKVALKPKALQDDVNHEVMRIRLAQGTGRPVRLKLASNAAADLDYTVFKPVSFYAEHPDLVGYFQAVRWLQVAPFVTDSPEDLLAIALLRLTLQSDHLVALKLNSDTDSLRDRRERMLSDLAGPADRPSVFGRLPYEPDNGIALYTTHKWIQVIVNDYKGKGFSSPGHPVEITSTLQPQSNALSAYVLPGSQLLDALFMEKLSRRHGPQYLPDALSIAAWLGSPYAAENEVGGEKAQKIRLEESPPLELSHTSSLHEKGLILLRRLFEKPAADAPAFMKTRAWQAKSCQTALTAWAQMRHVWTLRARPQYAVGAGIQEWPAFVEPLPDFFTGLADLCHETLQLLARAKVNLSSKTIARRLRRIADSYEKPPTDDEAKHRWQEMRMTVADLLYRDNLLSLDGDFNDPRNLATEVKHLRHSADIIERGEVNKNHPVAEALQNWINRENIPPLDGLEKVCLRLALLAHKQVRELPPLPEESEWLRYFGLHLSSFTDCHFTSATDDVPKAVRIFTNPSVGKALTAGIGRPRFLYVLYPWKGREILCRGAVLPYLESTTLQPLTDEEWKSRLHHPGDAPVQPAWLAPLRLEQ